MVWPLPATRSPTRFTPPLLIRSAFAVRPYVDPSAISRSSERTRDNRIWSYHACDPAAPLFWSDMTNETAPAGAVTVLLYTPHPATVLIGPSGEITAPLLFVQLI